MKKILAGFVLLAATAGGVAADSGVSACAPEGELNFICGIKSPEDLLPLPGGKWIVTSGMASKSGLHLIDVAAKTVEGWQPAPMEAAAEPYQACPSPPDLDNFRPHGISVRNHGDGRVTLYAVNHGGTVPPDFVADRGGRETIEVFDVDMVPEKPALKWRGCIPLPAGLVANSVTSAPDGTILATVMLHPGASFADILAGHATGAVYSWRPGAQGFRRVWGTELPANNGIAMSPDGKTFYVVSSLGINVFTNTNPAKQIHSTPLTDGNGDNIHWADGKVFVAGIKPVSDARCADIMKSISGELGEDCLPGYFVAAMEPGTFSLTTVAEGPRIKGFSSAVTVGLPVGNTLWLGTSFGDRVAYRSLP